MDEIAQLVEQVKILAQTTEIQTARMDQALKLLDERSTNLQQTDEALKQTIVNLETSREALTEALDDVDAQVDDLAKVTAALLLIQKSQESGA